MAGRRPTTPSIRRRQRNILEGIATRYEDKPSDEAFRLAAEEFGVTPQQLRKATLEYKPEKFRREYNRQSSLRKLYEEGDRNEVARTLELKPRRRGTRPGEFRSGIRKLPTQESSIRNLSDAKRRQYAELVSRLYGTEEVPRQLWASWTAAHGLPVSMDVMKLLYDNNYISKRQYNNAFSHWRSIYGVEDAWAAKYSLEDEEDFEE